LLDVDGGKKNGPPNEKLQTLKNPKEKKVVGPDKKTTTTTMYDSIFSRAVFKMEFDWKNAAMKPGRATGASRRTHAGRVILHPTTLALSC